MVPDRMQSLLFEPHKDEMKFNHPPKRLLPRGGKTFLMNQTPQLPLDHPDTFQPPGSLTTSKVLVDLSTSLGPLRILNVQDRKKPIIIRYISPHVG